jgi:MYXO-CTERM domain-containing protein
VAGAFGGVLILVSTVLSVIGTLETDAETSLGLTAILLAALRRRRRDGRDHRRHHLVAPKRPQAPTSA